MTVVRIATSEPDSTFHRQAVAVGEVWREDGVAAGATPLFTSGSVENAEMLADGRAEVAAMAANWLPLAATGKAPFGAALPVALLTPLNSGPLFFVARAESGLRSFDDLKGKRVALGPRDSGMVQHVHGIFRALGRPLTWFEPIYVTAGAGGELMMKGEIDAVWETPIPNPHFAKLTASLPVRALPFAATQRRAILAEVPYYAETAIPAGAFPGHEADMPTVAVINVLAVNAGADDDFVYRAAKSFIAHRADLPGRNALFAGLDRLLAEAGRGIVPTLAKAGAALHPAAARAFRDAGLLT